MSESYIAVLVALAGIFTGGLIAWTLVVILDKAGDKIAEDLEK